MATALPRINGRSGSKVSATAPPPIPIIVFSQKEHPLVTLGFEGARHHVPERLPSARRDRMVGIRVIELSEETRDNIIRASDTLKRLDLSNLGLHDLPSELTQDLHNLERLDVSNNELTEESFPAVLQSWENLIEFSAHNNNMSALPKCLKKLRYISRLKLGKNRIRTVEGIEKLKRLTMLVVDDNDLEIFSKELYSNLKRIEVLHCSRNRIRELSIDVRLFRQLREIDISDNQMSFLPAELFLLPKLDSINASNNCIARLPTIVVKGRTTNRLTAIDLSGNILVKFPDHLLLLCDSLDLSRNKIKTIPGKNLKKMDWRTSQQLFLEDNPLSNPPLDVCECGIRSIIQYFQEAKAEMKVYQGVKILVVGPYRGGKTSMVQTLVDLQGRLTDDDDRTAGIDTYETSLDLDGPQEGPLARQLQLTLWDFAGNQDYMYSHYFFLHQPSLTILVFNMAQYSTKEFHSQIGRWMSWMIAKSNKLNLVVVGTHADKLRKKKIQDICREVSDKIAAFNKRHVEAIENEIKKIESKAHIPPALSEQLKSYINLLKVVTKVYPKVIPFSSANMTGLVELNDAIIKMCTDKNIFPNVMRSIPSLWAEVENYVDEKGYTMPIPLVTWDSYVAEITKRFGMKHLIEQITHYLHESGKVLWYADHPNLKNYVILRPNWLMDLTKMLFKRDFADIESLGYEEHIKTLQLTPSRLEQIHQEHKSEGILSRDMIRLLWGNLVPIDSPKYLLEVTRFIVEQFEIGYIVDKPYPDGRVVVLSKAPPPTDKAETGEMEQKEDFPPISRPGSMQGYDRSESAASGAKSSLFGQPKPVAMVPSKFNRLLIPWMRETRVPPTFKEEYETYAGSPAVVANFRFPQYTPSGLFETICTRAATRCNLETLFHWASGLYARHVEEPPCRFYLLRIHHDDGSTCVRVEVRHECFSDLQDIENLWGVLLPFLKGFDTLISLFSGARVERNMECPNCHALTFLGEWFTPKELQNLPCKTCESCKTEISTAFLVQPKEKKKVEEFLRQRLLSERNASQPLEEQDEELMTGCQTPE